MLALCETSWDSLSIQSHFLSITFKSKEHCAASFPRLTKCDGGAWGGGGVSIHKASAETTVPRKSSGNAMNDNKSLPSVCLSSNSLLLQRFLKIHLGWEGGVRWGGGHCDCPLTAEDGWGLVQMASSVWTQPQIGLSGHKNGTLLWVSPISNKWRQQVQVERGRRLHPSELKWLQMNYFNEKRKRLSVFSAVQSDIYFRT